MSTRLPLPRPRTRLVNVQVLRGIAALLVIVAHGVDLDEEIGGSPDAPGVIGHLQNVGAFGVDLFFVVSGFVMAMSVAGKSGPRSAGDFLARRWIRIAPPYLIASAVVILVIGYYRRALPTTEGLLNMILFVPVFDRGGWSPPPLDIGWTLSFEFTFYLLVALGMLLRARAETLALGLVALVLLGRLLPTHAFIVSWFTNPILIEFALGITIYAAWSRGWLSRFRPLWLVGGALAVLALTVEILTGYGEISEQQFTTDGTLSAQRTILWGIPAALILLAVITAREPKRGRVLQVGRRLGDASYSTYLLHRPALIVFGAQLGFSPFPVPPVVTVLVGVLVGTGTGLLYFSTVERPLTQRLSDWYQRSTPSGRARLRQDLVRPPGDTASAPTVLTATPIVPRSADAGDSAPARGSETQREPVVVGERGA